MSEPMLRWFFVYKLFGAGCFVSYPYECETDASIVVEELMSAGVICSEAFSIENDHITRAFIDMKEN